MDKLYGDSFVLNNSKLMKAVNLSISKKEILDYCYEFGKKLKNMRKIFITGGCGFIGSHLVEKIFKEFKNSKIVVYDKITYAGDIRNLSQTIKSKRIKFIKKRLN